MDQGQSQRNLGQWFSVGFHWIWSYFLHFRLQVTVLHLLICIWTVKPLNSKHANAINSTICHLYSSVVAVTWITFLLLSEYWLTDWLIDWLIGWLIDWLTDWLTDWLIDCEGKTLYCSPMTIIDTGMATKRATKNVQPTENESNHNTNNCR